MAEASVTEAIYKLRYEGGDSSVSTLTRISQAAERAALGTDKLATSEERLGKSSLNLLASLDPRIRAEQAAARQLEHFSRLHADGAITVERYASTLKLVENNLKTKVSAMDGAVSTTARLGDSIGGLITRYTSWATIIIAVRRLAQEAIRTDVEAAAAVDRLGVAYSDLAKNLAPTIVMITDWLTTLVTHTNNVVKGVKDAVAEIARAPILGGVGNRLPNSPMAPGFNLSASMDSSSRNWTPGAQGFPTSGFTDLTARAEAAKKANAEQQKFYEAEADRIHKLTEAEAKRWEAGRILREKERAEFDKGVIAQLKGITQIGIAQEVQNAKNLQGIIRLNEEVDNLRQESGRKYDEEAERSREREREKITRYWDDVTHQMDAAGKDFFTEFAQTGILNFKSLTDKMLSTWTSTLYDMAKQGKLFGEGGLFGGSGGGFGGILNSVGSFIGKWGGLIGAGVGLIQKIFQSKPSDNRSVATFMPGMTDFGFGAQSAHESSQASLVGVQQAAELIRQQILAFKQVGIEFTSQLSNIWLGERDASTFQLAGGQRVSAGSVGDPTDLANDVLAALLKSATSSDPAIAKMLAGGSDIAEIQQALAFGLQITDALAQITDPLKYAIDLWKRESQARLDMAAATGFSIDKVKELNGLLYQQITAQQNAGAISGLDTFVNSLEYGPGSGASPKSQYSAAFADYDAARKAALANPSAQTAGAFQQAAGSFLPIANQFWGTTQTYDSFVQGAIGTAKQLQGVLGAPPSMAADLQPLVLATTQFGAAQVEALGGIDNRLVVLTDRFDRLSGQLDGLTRKLAATS